jgi:hypothetical protein
LVNGTLSAAEIASANGRLLLPAMTFILRSSLLETVPLPPADNAEHGAT